MVTLVPIFDFYKLISNSHVDKEKWKIDKRADKIKYLKYFNYMSKNNIIIIIKNKSLHCIIHLDIDLRNKSRVFIGVSNVCAIFLKWKQ